MLSLNQFYNKLNYFKTCLIKFVLRQGNNCPSCNSDNSIIVERKYLITSLKKCHNCQLMFRVPNTTVKENKIFYQDDYSQEFSTDCPNNEQLKIMIKNNFIATERDYTKYIEILKIIKDQNNNNTLDVFDFGCSWGYGSFQLKKEFNVISYEISQPRARYAKERLNIDVLSENQLRALENSERKFDIFFMSHVLEHLPTPKKTLDFAMKVLKKNGYIISFTPNGSLMHKKINKNWSKLWGQVHPNFIDEGFYKNYFKDNNYYIGSAPYNFSNIKNFLNEKNNIIDNLSGDELFIIAKNN